MEEKTIFLVEDNPSDVGLTRRALQRKGIPHSLAVARDGEEALDSLFPTDAPAGPEPLQPTLILLDLNLPKVDGLAVLQRIRAEGRTRLIPVVVLSTSSEAADIEAAYALGATSYIRKPVDSLKFADAIEQLARYWLVLNEPPSKMR